MMRIATVFLLVMGYMSQAQPVAEFDFPQGVYSVCKNENVLLSNNSTGATHFLWDFCPETFQESPMMTSLQTDSGLSAGASYKIVRDGDRWFGFLVNRSANKLIRLDFGNNPASIPVLQDLGNPGNYLNSPEGIDIYFSNGAWYGFIGYNGDIARLDFGTSLANIPVATRLNLAGPKRFADVKVVEQNGLLVLLSVVTQDNTIRRVNFGTSFSNSPVVTNISVGTVEFPLGISIVKTNARWIAHLTSFVQNGSTKFSVTQLSFGSDILAAPSVEGTYNFASVEKPYRIKLHQTGGNYIGVISNELKKLAIINFHDLNPANVPVELPNSALPVSIGFDVLKYEGKSLLHANENSTSSLKLFSYERGCEQNVSWSTGNEPSGLRFNATGTFKIDLTASSDKYSLSEASGELTVTGYMAPEIFIIHDNICQSAQVKFSVGGSSGNLTQWSWDLGDGNTSAFNSPQVIYSNDGSYPVLLEVGDDNGCRAYDTLELQIYPPPVADFYLSPTLLCTNTTIIFPTTTPDIYDGNLSYQWFVDDGPVSAERDLQYTFTDTGPKEIKLMTSIPGCADEITKTTASVEAGPVVDFSFTGTCEDETFSFQNETSGSAESYQWNFDNGQTATTFNASQRFNEPGDFSVSLTAINAVGCENVKTRTLRVHSKPLIDFLVDGPPNACSGVNTDFRNQTVNPDGSLITEWLWAFGDATPPLQQNTGDAQHLFANGGTYHVTLTATTEYGCAGTGEKSVSIHQAPSTSYASTPACDDVPVVFTGPVDNSISSLYWEIGTSYYDGPSVTHTFKSPGDYPLYLELAGSNGCIATVTRTIHVPAPLVPDFSVLKNCVGQETIFTDITSGSDPVSSREWRFQSGEAFSSSPLIRTFGALGEYDVTLQVTAASGCVYDITKEVQVLSPPAAAFAADPASGAYPLEVSFVNTSVQATHYLWEFSDGTGATSTERSPVHTYPEAGTFPVKLVASNDQQCESVAIANVTIVAPLPDADIELLALSSNPDGSLKLIATIHNKGNTILKDLPMEIDLSGKLSLRHVVGEPILPGTKYNAVLGAGILDPGNLDYICVVIDVAHDLNPTFNKVCQDLKDQSFVFPAYPNPATELLNIEWIAEGRKTVVISLADAMGRKVCSVETSGGTGLNRWSLDLRGLENGVYLLLIDDGRLRSSQKILVINKP
ncbi:MAG: PKD domain-containing protein [Chryseosolibacter sp.]